jgi:BirA family biotin operon repressor/biotin-[acetyl-CoA-carboxylase] ligase
MGRSWASPRGASLLFSVLLREREAGQGEAGEGEAPAEPRVSGPVALPLLAAIACRDGIAAASDVSPLLHWPNDLYVGARKLGGILIETRPISGFGQAFIIGVGINCLQKPAHFTPELRARATSLEIESRAAVQREVVAAAVLNELEAWIGAPQRYSAAVLREAWLSRAAPLGQRVRLREDGVEYVGCIVDLDPAAGIVVQLERGGRRSFAAARTTIVERSFLSP